MESADVQVDRHLEVSRQACQDQRWDEAMAALGRAKAVFQGPVTSQWWLVAIEIEIGRRNWQEGARIAQ